MLDCNRCLTFSQHFLHGIIRIFNLNRLLAREFTCVKVKVSLFPKEWLHICTKYIPCQVCIEYLITLNTLRR